MFKGSSTGVAAPGMPARFAPAITALALGLLGALVWEAVPPPGVWHDDGAYLLLGESLAEGDGLHYSRVSGSPPGAVELLASWSGGMLVRLRVGRGVSLKSLGGDLESGHQRPSFLHHLISPCWVVSTCSPSPPLSSTVSI